MPMDPSSVWCQWVDWKKNCTIWHHKNETVLNDLIKKDVTQVKKHMKSDFLLLVADKLMRMRFSLSKLSFKTCFCFKNKKKKKLNQQFVWLIPSLIKCKDLWLDPWLKFKSPKIFNLHYKKICFFFPPIKGSFNQFRIKHLNRCIVLTLSTSYDAVSDKVAYTINYQSINQFPTMVVWVWV